MKKIKKNLALFIMCAIILQISFCPINATANSDNHLKNNNFVSEMRGVWVASVYNLDYPTVQTTDVQTLKNETIKILDDANIEYEIFADVKPNPTVKNVWMRHIKLG